MKHKVMTPSISGYGLLNNMNDDDDEHDHDDFGFNPIKQEPIDDPDEEISFNSPSLNSSPTKPLNFPRIHQKTKEFNSSSDTYTSDHNEEQAVDQQEPKNTSFDRNFSFDDSKDAIKTVQQSPVAAPVAAPPVALASSLIEKDPFSSKTPLTSTTDLSPEKQINRVITSSPSKSIMKKGNTQYGSPTKKNVVFTSSNPEIHHYKKEETATEDEYSLQSQSPAESSWNAVQRSMDEISSDDDGEEPPVPPPHSNYSNLTAISDDESTSKEPSAQELKKIKRSSLTKSLSNLSLNEKLDVFLSNNNNQTNNHNNTGFDTGTKSKTTADDLDAHLNDLESGKALQTDNNIHNLSLNLQTQKLDQIENPLNSLSRSGNVELDSGNTSRSSVQSLKDDERILVSDNVSKVAKSVELNDGIKGFPDHMVESLIPENEAKRVPNNVEPPKVTTLERNFVDSSNDEFHDSFDQSYNNTEQSIMDLLKRQPPSQTAMHSNDSITQVKKEDDDLPYIKKEEEFDEPTIPINSAASDIQDVKEEPLHSFSIPVPVKQEVEEETHSTNNNLSISPDLRRDLEHIHNHTTEIASVSGFGVPNDNREIKLVKAEQKPKDINNSEEYDSLHEDSNQFSLRDHIDEDWKFEDSNDGDREDNDEYTNNEITRETIVHKDDHASIIPDVNEKDTYEDDTNSDADNEDNSGEKFSEADVSSVKSKRERMLEVDLSPNVSGELVRDESVKSLAPPKVESPIKSPVKSLFGSERGTPLNGSPIKRIPEKREPVVIEKKFEPKELFKNFDKDLAEVEPIERTTVPLQLNSKASTALPVNKNEAVTSTSTKEVPVNSTPSTAAIGGNNLDVDHDEALANSSNIAINEDITLPPLETNNYSSFEELKKTLDISSMSYEESLSAEHDKDPQSPTNFLSIWHSQDKFKTSNHTNDVLENYEVSQRSLKIPASLQPKKFKEVNVITRRIVSPGFEDLNVSGFLPEISQDSGFENHFKGIMKSRNNDATNSSAEETGQSASIQPEAELHTILPKDINDSTDSSRTLPKPRLMPPKANFKPVVVKRSQFKVPSFEIKRGNSILSPRNQYNDIFADTVKPRRNVSKQNESEKENFVEDQKEIVLDQPPTIKSNGMRTLPSMDRDDVQKILNTKRIISQEEYSKLKLVGYKKKEALIEQENKYDHLQQQASIHDAGEEDDFDEFETTNNTSMVGRELPEGASITRHAADPTGSILNQSLKEASILPHLADELLRVPAALHSKDQYFKESEFSSPVRDVANSSSEMSSRVSSVIHTKKPVTLAPKHVISQHFPEPDPELCHDIFKTPPKELDTTLDSVEDEEAQQRLLNYDRVSAVHKKKKILQVKESSSTPIKSNKSRVKSSPIKIGSPVQIIKTSDGGVTAVSPKRTQRTSSFTGNDLSYDKLRDTSPQKKINQLHTVNVPSTSTNNTEVTASSSADLLSSASIGNTTRKVSGQSGSDITMTSSHHQSRKPLSERGRLFLRVVGLKNLDLPDLRTREADFTMTLDNGVHCIKTPSYNLNDRNISIGKEFELTVGEGGLEFILTMKANYEKAKGGLREVRERKVVKSKNRISRMFGSKEIVTTTKFVPVEVEDSWEGKFAQDGSFARCYVDLEQYEGKATGKVCNFDITCFNEWATVLDSKGDAIKCKPYRIGQLEVKMLFIPRTLNQEVLPSSIKSAYESVSALRNELSLYKEGYLHQEGGDCEIWKRRFFKLQGTALIAHSEYNHKTRAKINLAKVVEVIYVDKDNSNGQNNLRNFSDVLLLEHSFKIRFGNGELIDFGAPNKQEKKEWIAIIEKIIHRNKFRVQPWVKIMLECNNIQPYS